jgi:CHASE3 domain sensor protein
MGGQKINSRLTFTIVVQLVILVGIGLIAYLGINRVGNALVDVSHTVETQADMRVVVHWGEQVKLY